MFKLKKVKKRKLKVGLYFLKKEQSWDKSEMGKASLDSELTKVFFPLLRWLKKVMLFFLLELGKAVKAAIGFRICNFSGAGWMRVKITWKLVKQRDSGGLPSEVWMGVQTNCTLKKKFCAVTLMHNQAEPLCSWFTSRSCRIIEPYLNE